MAMHFPALERWWTADCGTSVIPRPSATLFNIVSNILNSIILFGSKPSSFSHRSSLERYPQPWLK